MTIEELKDLSETSKVILEKVQNAKIGGNGRAIINLNAMQLEHIEMLLKYHVSLCNGEISDMTSAAAGEEVEE